MKCLKVQFLACSFALTSCHLSLFAQVQGAEFPASTRAAQSAVDVGARSANSSFGLLKAVFAKPDKSKWEEALRSAGLAPWRGHEGMWRLEAPDGEVRAQAFFQGNETSVFLLFFPATKSPLSEATLSWMYRTAAGYFFEDGEGVELRFPEETITSGTGRRRQSFSLSLTTSTLTRTVVTMEWK